MAEDSRWADINDQQVCCGEKMIPTFHEGQPIADQVRRGYLCSKCATAKTIFIDVFDRTWEVAKLDHPTAHG